jgi:hypothetical protein
MEGHCPSQAPDHVSGDDERANDGDVWTVDITWRVRGEQHGHIGQDRHIGVGHRTARQHRSA